jgi:hypothetical protein
MNNHLQKLSLTFLILLLNQLAFAQSYKVRGRLTDANGNALQFANIALKNSNQGTTTNEEGDYVLKLNSGKYELVFQYVGFKSKTMEVTIEKEDLIVDVSLESENLLLKEINVFASDQDPAYGIIRQAQAKRKYYLREEVKTYKCRAYSKGLQRLTKKPKSIFGTNIVIDTGIVYFSESLSELAYQQPESYKEKMISSRVSGNNRGFSFNSASDAWINLYKNITGEDNTERGVVSPIAANAMAYYRYRLEGSFVDNGKTIFKIRLIPRRRNAPAYSGFIYIMDETWRVHSAELYMRKDVVEFIDSATAQLIYAPIQGTEVWLPRSQKITFNFKAFGFEGGGYAAFVYSNYEVEPNLPKKFFDAEVFSVEKDANKRDSLYWKEIRPMPLTVEEIRDYRVKDSLQVIKESKPYKDSLDNHRNKLRIANVFLTGYTYRKSFENLTISVPPIFSWLQYNTVEGLVAEVSPDFRKRYEDRRNWVIAPTLRYGFGNQRFQAKIDANYVFKPLKSAFIAIEGGQYVEQISRTNSISPFANSFYTLLDEQNFLKIYQKTYGAVRYGQEISNGVRFNAGLEYAHRSPMENLSNPWKIRDVANREFTANTPFLGENEPIQTSFMSNNALLFNLGLTFNFGQKYALYPDRKFITESKYPTLVLNYRKGINALGSEVNFDFVSLRVNDNVPYGMIGEAEWLIEAGSFLNTAKMTFVDFRHFLGNQTMFLRQELGGYQLLDYYRHSTNDTYVKAHYEHHFNGFLTNSIPFIKKLKWQLVAGANYLYTNRLGHYIEFGAGIEHIFKILRVDYYLGAQEGQKLNSGLRIGFGF